MEYLIIVGLQILGILLSVVQKITVLDKKYPDLTKREIFAVFLDEDWTTLAGSFVVLCLNLLGHYIVENYAPQTKEFIGPYYILYGFGLALLLGYAGQRLIYKWLGSAEKALDNKVTNKLS